jgi:catechol 2,3-dioxygenase-like lactoylglutathione lyase family enzyme
LPVADIEQASAFYTRAGFDVRSYEGGGFAFVSYEDESLFDLDPADAFDVSANRAGCYLVVPDADAWHLRLIGAGLSVTDIGDQPWGMREFTLTDPDGNHIRIGHGIED